MWRLSNQYGPFSPPLPPLCMHITQLQVAVKKLYDEYISPTAPRCINVDDRIQKAVESKLSNPPLNIFHEAQEHVGGVSLHLSSSPLLPLLFYSLPLSPPLFSFFLLVLPTLLLLLCYFPSILCLSFPSPTLPTLSIFPPFYLVSWAFGSQRRWKVLVTYFGYS